MYVAKTHITITRLFNVQRFFFSPKNDNFQSKKDRSMFCVKYNKKNVYPCKSPVLLYKSGVQGRVITMQMFNSECRFGRHESKHFLRDVAHSCKNEDWVRGSAALWLCGVTLYLILYLDFCIKSMIKKQFSLHYY